MINDGPERGGMWHRRPQSDCAIVFVHGFLSSNEAWRSGNYYWPDLVVADSQLKDVGIYLFSYRTDAFSGTYGLGDAVEALNTYLKLDGVLSLDKLVFVCHSMGGIIVRQWVVTRQASLIEKQGIIGLFLVASPSLGSDYANMLEALGKALGNTQAQALRFSEENGWLNDLDRNFINLKESGRVRLIGQELIEDVFVIFRPIFRKQIVRAFSGAKYFGDSIKIPNSDHFSIAKPAGADALQHRLLVQFLLTVANSQSQPSAGPAKAPASQQRNDNSTQPSMSDLSQLFGAPRVDGYIRRRALEAQLAALVDSHPIVSVEGLAGSGKSYLAAYYCESAQRSKDYSDVVWHDVKDAKDGERETLDSLIARLSDDFNLDVGSIDLKCRKLFAELDTRRILLVIDDFHFAETESYSPLLRAASRSRGRARLLLVSRYLIDLQRGFAKIERVRLGGFENPEFTDFCKKRGVSIDEQTAIRFLEVTDGLPLAASLFTTLIERGWSPDDLLQGDNELPIRLEFWFEQVRRHIEPNELKLLRALSLSEGPFNLGVVRTFTRVFYGNVQSSPFDRLEHMYLVSSAKPGSWRVHHLIGIFSQAGMEATEQHEIHRIFAEYYLAGLPRSRDIMQVQHLLWKATACRHFIMARAFSKSEQILTQIVPTVKSRGYYLLFIQLCQAYSSHQSLEGWLAYHYAHCCLIVGHFKSALAVIEAIRFRIPASERNLRLAAARMQAELMESLGEISAASSILAEAMQAVRDTDVEGRQYAHAKSIQAYLLIEAERFSDAAPIIEELTEISTKKHDDLGLAVALMRKVQLAERNNELDRHEGDLINSLALFRKCQDQRGSSWALIYYGLVLTQTGRSREGLSAIAESLDIKDQIGDCSRDCLHVLQELRPLIADAGLRTRVDGELRRLRSFYGISSTAEA